MKQLLRSAFMLVMMCLVSGAAMAQFTVKGKVVDEFKEGVPGANIVVKGTSQGVVTNLDGDYTISVPNKNSVLVISFIGYTTQEINVNGRPTINVTLGENAEVLSEVVVVGYGTQRKGDLTGALTTFKPDEIGATQSISVNSMLEGKVAGLVVSTASSQVGAASSITIRGANSLRGDNQPLYVIDNVPQASTGEFAGSAVKGGAGAGGDFQVAQDPLSALNPADIEDITILKDASATAIYGSRGANGVILITTKKGKSGRVKVQATANFTISQAANLLDVLNLQEYARYKNSAVTSSHEVTLKDGSVVSYPNATFQFGDNGEVRYVFSSNIERYNPEDENTYRVIDNINWQKEIYRSAFSHQYNVSLSGGGEKATYYISAAFKDIEGTTKNTGIQQGDLRATLHGELSKKVTLDMTLAGSLRTNDMMAGGSGLGGSTGAVSATALQFQPFLTPEDDPNYDSNPQNKTTVFSWLTDYVDKNENKSFKGSLDLKWNIIDGLTYDLRIGGNMSNDSRRRWYGTSLYRGMLEQGLLAKTDLKKVNYTIEHVLNYNTTFGDWAKLDATAGFTYDHYEFLNEQSMGTHFDFFEMRENGMHNANTQKIYMPIQSDYQLMSYLGRINFTLLDKYLITASLRADGSSKFAKGNRWGYFPSASIAWRLNDEKWFENVDWLSQLKVRLSYGMTGSQSISPYQTLPVFQVDPSYEYATGSGGTTKPMVIAGLPNSGITWEKTGSWNIGIDFGFWKNRLNGNIDLYSKKTTDLLVSRKLPGSAGYASTFYNSGDLTNKGIEFTLEGIIFDSKNFHWSIRGNIGANKSEISALGTDPAEFGSLGEHIGYYGNSVGDHFEVSNIFLEGYAPGLFLGYKTQGVISDNDIERDADGNATGRILYTKPDGTLGAYTTKSVRSNGVGDIKYVDVDGDGVITANDRTIIGDPNPGFTYGFGTTLRYKDLQLTMSFNGVQNRDVLNLNNRYLGCPGSGSNILKSTYKNMWSKDNPTGTRPAITYVIDSAVKDFYVEDASYLRCSDITLSYNLPKNWMKKIGFTSASVYGTVKNAFVITNYTGYDPEVNSFAFDGLKPGLDYNSYPGSRQWIIGVNITY